MSAKTISVTIDVHPLPLPDPKEIKGAEIWICEYPDDDPGRWEKARYMKHDETWAWIDDPCSQFDQVDPDSLNPGAVWIYPPSAVGNSSGRIER